MGYLLTDHDFSSPDDILTDADGNYLTDEIPYIFGLEDYAIQYGLSVFADEADLIVLCSDEPTSYVEATSTYLLASKDFGVPGGAFGAIADATPSGRKVTSVQFDDGTVDTSGLGAYIAICDSVSSRFLASGAVVTPRNVLVGRNFGLPSFAITLSTG